MPPLQGLAVYDSFDPGVARLRRLTPGYYVLRLQRKDQSAVGRQAIMLRVFGAGAATAGLKKCPSSDGDYSVTRLLDLLVRLF